MVCYGLPQVFSISDARHDIMRDIQMILLNVDLANLRAYRMSGYYQQTDEFCDLAKYHKSKYEPLMSGLGPDPEVWLRKGLARSTCLKYAKILHY